MTRKPQRSSRPYKSPRRSRNRRSRRKHLDNRVLTERRNLERLKARQNRDLARRLLRDGDDPSL